MKAKTTLLSTVVLSALLVAGIATRHDQAKAANSPAKSANKTSALAYHDTWRKLWEDHITWTRMVIIGVLDMLPGVTNYQARLLQNYEDMEDALKPYYGDDAEELGDLIQDHLLIAVELLNAAKARNTMAFDDAKARWYQNGEEIAMLMAALNPRHWKLSEAEMMWHDHLDATLDEAVAHLTNDFAGDIAAYDKVHLLALDMADFFSNGVISQFGNRFKGESALKD